MLQAAEKGVPFMPLRGIIGSDILGHRPDWKVIDNPFDDTADPIVLLPALSPDIAVFHAAMADANGNVWVGRRRELATIAHASKRVLATVERITQTDLLTDERLAPGTISATYIEAVAVAERGAWPLALLDEYPADAAHLAEYARLARSEEGFPRLSRPPRPECARAGSRMIQKEERLAAALARLILDPTAPRARHIAVGAASPIPAAACWLVKQTGAELRLSFLHKRTGNPFTEGSRELFDLAGQGRIDLFFLGGGQIDGQANINLIGTGEWPGATVRFPGSFGSAFMYLMTPRTLLFREEHSRRVPGAARRYRVGARRLAQRRVPSRHRPGARDRKMRVPVRLRAGALRPGLPSSRRDREQHPRQYRL